MRIQGTQLPKVSETARLLAERSRQLKTRSQNYDLIEVLGPAEAPLAKLRGNYRYHLLLKGLDHRLLNSFSHQILGDHGWVPSGVKISVDVDPLHLL
jgi:primosomal protein N' (replication factor Y)